MATCLQYTTATHLVDGVLSAGLAVPQGNGARLYKNELASGRNIQNTKNPELRFRALLDEDGTRHIELAKA